MLFRSQANARSKKHYQTDQGRRNKKRLNGRRSIAGSDNGSLTEAASRDTARGDEEVSSTDTSSPAEARLLASIAEGGIEEPLSVTSRMSSA